MENIIISNEKFAKSYPNLFNDMKGWCLFDVNEETPFEQFWEETRDFKVVEVHHELLKNNEELLTNYWFNEVIYPLEKVTECKVFPLFGATSISINALFDLEKFKTESTIYFGMIYISLVGKYFSIKLYERKYNIPYNIDTSGFKNVDFLEYEEIETIAICSPIEPFTDIFLKIENYLRNKLPDYLFSPAIFDYIKVKGLTPRNNFTFDTAISSCLFNRDHNSSYKGDVHYGDIKVIE